MKPRQPILVTLISDATGSLGEHVLQAVFTQFPPDSFRLRVLNFVNSEEQLKICLERLHESKGLIVHATVYEEFKRKIEAECTKCGLPVHDLTEPVMSFLISSSGIKQDVSYGKLHELNPDYFKRVSAIEYAIEHDDGGGLRTLREADVVLTGVSRTTKTPTCMVLATRGFRAANVPLVLGVAPPGELLSMGCERVICLMVDPRRLAAFRTARVKEQLGFDGGYTDEGKIIEELNWARNLSQTNKWRTVDVSGGAVEETAARIIQLLPKK